MLKNLAKVLILSLSLNFFKSKDIEILPPPPPFPKFQVSEKKSKSPNNIEKLQKGLELPEIKQELKPIEKEEIKIPKSVKKEIIRIKKKETKTESTDSLLNQQLKDLKKESDKAKGFQIISKAAEVNKPVEVSKSEEEIQKAITKIKKQKEKKPLFKSIFKPKEKKPEKDEPPVEFMPRTFEKSAQIDDILDKIHEAQAALMKFDLDEAKRIYIEIMRIYSNLSGKEKAKIYQDIKDLYDERKNAESLNLA